MAHRISFFTYSEWDSDRDCMAFIALVDGLRTRCLIRADALVELAQEHAKSPIRTFSEHREAVQELARDLIQKERMDGRELVIRLSDVQESRVAAIVCSTTIDAMCEPLSQPALSVADARRMTISDDSRDSVWRSICDRQRAACLEASRRAHRALAVRASEETNTFEAQPRPTTAHELNLRRVEATRMTASWRAELLSAAVS